MTSRPWWILLFAALAAGAEDRNLLPKYGALPKSGQQQAADKAFLAAIDQEYRGDRKKASKELAARGWRFLKDDADASAAMRRFNQAWLLDEKNGDAIWGMAAVQAGAGKLDESMRLFAEAETLIGKNLSFSVDHAKALAMAGIETGNQDQLKDAFGRFERLEKEVPQNTQNLQNWAIALFLVGQYSEAWKVVKRIEAMPNKGDLEPRFLQALEERMPRPN